MPQNILTSSEAKKKGLYGKADQIVWIGKTPWAFAGNDRWPLA